ncbi:unnamed protein product [Rotaria magnacalcarata]|uniref:B box-type domain-containing protein n=2 Tax=Rotaria magnacalcarata TaxID=392030 RepID=A0A816JSG1_9BILA|nr:unnamed protein product [Rotaria magnacalcarata]
MTSSINKSFCITCNKKQAFFTCSGCRQDFCEDHINEEHQSPVTRMNDFLTDHNQLQELVCKYMEEPQQHSLIQQIDKWERQSINKIQQTADDARTKVLNVISDHVINIKKSLENLSEKVEQIQNDEKFTEIYLRQWRDKLENLKKDLITPETIQIHQHDDHITFVSKLTVIIVEPKDLFERTAGNIRIDDNGQLMIHGQWSDHSAVRGKGEYSSGQYRFRFKIEELDSDKWAFFGIVSKNVPMRAISISTPTAYGLAGQDGICLSGIYQKTNTIQYQSDMEMNDIIELFIDCNHQIIRLKNERTHSSHELNIDINKCPFPWQLLLGLCCSAGDRIRILPCTYIE